MNMREEIKRLEAERERIKLMGGEERVKRQHDRGKLTARERIDLLFDEGTFTEVGMLGTVMGTPVPQQIPADGVVCGFGKVNGRHVSCVAYDFTVKGGSIGFAGEKKATRLREIALRERMPMVWLVDSGNLSIVGYCLACCPWIDINCDHQADAASAIDGADCPDPGRSIVAAGAVIGEIGCS